MIKKAPKYPTEECPEGPYGHMDKPKSKRRPEDSLKEKSSRVRPEDKVKTQKPEFVSRRTKKEQPIGSRRVRDRDEPAPTRRKTRVLPEIKINYDNATLPAEAAGLDLMNVVNIPDQLLKNLSLSIEGKTKDAAKLILLSAATSILSYDAASSYAKTVLRDGLAIDVSVDNGVGDVLRDMTRMDLLFYYVKRLQIPQPMKRLYMATLVEELAKRAAATLDKADKSNAISDVVGTISKRLEGVVVRKKSDVKTGDDPNSESPPKSSSKLGAARFPRAMRGNKPIGGGF